jgi:hypothetical protein
METPSPASKLLFVQEFSEREASEARDRGYLSHVLVEVDGRDLYPVFFYDPIRLRQDLEASAKTGRPYVADPGMIVLPDITIEAMEAAVRGLCAEGFFKHLVPVTKDCLDKANPYSWPPDRT